MILGLNITAISFFSSVPLQGSKGGCDGNNFFQDTMNSFKAQELLSTVFSHVIIMLPIRPRYAYGKVPFS